MKNRFKKLLALTAGLVACGMLSQQALAVPLLINFGNFGAGQVTFPGGGNFDFTPGGPAGLGNFSLSITFSSVSPASVGDVGTLTGPWNFGTIGVTVGTLSILDNAAAFNLTADVVWKTVVVNGVGTSGQLNVNDVVNLNNINYPLIGADPTLIALRDLGSADITLSWTFPTVGHTLPVLTAGGPGEHTSFSGSIFSSTPDGGLTVALLGFAFLSVEGLRRKLTK